jgi:hypothetical protein
MSFGLVLQHRRDRRGVVSCLFEFQFVPFAGGFPPSHVHHALTAHRKALTEVRPSTTGFGQAGFLIDESNQKVGRLN